MQAPLRFVCLCIISAISIVSNADGQEIVSNDSTNEPAKMVADQRDAINREIDAKSAPNALANAATKLGMDPSESPIFLNLQPSEVSNG